MKYATLSFSQSGNVGDHVQSIAIERLLPRLDTHLDRSFLATSSTKDPTLLVLNCWFSNCTTTFPPAQGIKPIFYGFHIHEEIKGEFLTPTSIDYLKKHQPIGCRDHGTAKMLKEAGIETFYSRCLTLTLPRRAFPPKAGKIIAVDAYDIPMPSSIKKSAIHISHIVPVVLSEESKRSIASELLKYYSDNASLIITTKLHCALPCAAMGIPVVFFGDVNDYRLEVLKDIGITVNPYKLPKNKILKQAYIKYRKFNMASIRHVDWAPSPVDFEQQKCMMSAQLKEMIAKAAGE
jgi:hypothetical protein